MADAYGLTRGLAAAHASLCRSLYTRTGVIQKWPLIRRQNREIVNISARPILAQHTACIAGVRIQRPIRVADAGFLQERHQTSLPGSLAILPDRATAELAHQNWGNRVSRQIRPVSAPDT